MTISFDDAHYSVARAKNHIADFERQSAEFLASNAYTRVTEIDPDGGQEVHKLKLTKPMPVALKGIVKDAAINLRSALDHAMFAIGGRNSYFPIADTESAFMNGVKGRCKNLPKDIVDIVIGFKPYKRGNEPLWALNELSNSDKHGIIRPVALVAGRIEARNLDVNATGPGEMFPEWVWDRTKDELIIARLTPGSTIEGNIKFTTFIAFCEVEVLDGLPALAVLNKFLGIVEGIVMAIEAETKRIGLLK